MKDKIANILKAYTKKEGIMASHLILEEYAEELIKNGCILHNLQDVMEVKHGRWTTNSDYPDSVICNKCGWREDVMWADTGTKFCPNCGAKMDKQ